MRSDVVSSASARATPARAALWTNGALRPLLAVALVTAVLHATSVASGVRAQAAPRSGTALGQVTVLIDGFRSDQGDALLALFRHADDFPREPEKAERRELTRIEAGRARIVIGDLTPGVFALSVLHDEDGDRKVKTGMFGIPREGIGFSRNARGMFGPPRFADARLTLAAGANLTVSIRMHYY